MLVFRTGGFNGFLIKQNQIAAGLRELDKPLLRGVRILKRWTQENIESGGAKGGFSWPPLSPRTIREKQAEGYGDKPLIRTGKMRDSWSEFADRKVGRLTSNTLYARKHQFGEQVPQRPIFPTNREAMQLLMPIFHHHVRINVR